MADSQISVVIPVGPNPTNIKWFEGALNSVYQQTLPPKEIIVIDDWANLLPIAGVRIWKAPWRLGVAHAFNMGVGLANTPCVFMLGSDDVLEPDCLRYCVQRWQRKNQAMGYYSVTVRYMHSGVVQTLPCNAAMVTKDLWEYTGGFPVESAIGAPDAAFLSILMKHRPELIVHVKEGTPLYNYRDHTDTETMRHYHVWENVIVQTRDLLTHLGLRSV